MDNLKRFFLTASIVSLVMLSFPITVRAASKSKKALKSYKRFLSQNVSNFDVVEGDFYTTNKENYKKCSDFMVLDLDKNGISELVTYHPKGYKQGYLCVYTYRNGKIVRLKNKKNKTVKISEDCNAAGWYDNFSCTKGHLHVRWEGGWLGYSEDIYTVKNGKLRTYLSAKVDNNAGTSSYRMNGNKIDAEKYESVVNKCTVSKKHVMRKNTAQNRNKYVK